MRHPTSTMGVKRVVLDYVLPYLSVPVRIGLAAVFFAAAWHKILYPETFALNVATYQMLPLQYINLTTLVLPWLELVVAVLLVVGWLARPSALATIGMLVVFMFAIYYALDQDLMLGACGCFASEEAAHELNWETFYRDVYFMAMAVYVLLFDRGKLGIEGFVAWRRKRRAS